VQFEHWFTGDPQQQRLFLWQPPEAAASMNVAWVYTFASFLESTYPVDGDGDVFFQFWQKGPVPNLPLMFQLRNGQLSLRRKLHPDEASETLAESPARTLYGHWTQWQVEAIWSQEAGSLAVSRDGVPMLNFSGPTALESLQPPRCAFGIYHWHAATPFAHKCLWLTEPQMHLASEAEPAGLAGI
jgi:hypothetical protein